MSDTTSPSISALSPLSCGDSVPQHCLVPGLLFIYSENKFPSSCGLLNELSFLASKRAKLKIGHISCIWENENPLWKKMRETQSYFQLGTRMALIYFSSMSGLFQGLKLPHSSPCSSWGMHSWCYPGFLDAEAASASDGLGSLVQVQLPRWPQRCCKGPRGHFSFLHAPQVILTHSQVPNNAPWPQAVFTLKYTYRS